MPNSGRGVYYRKSTVHASRVLDLLDIQRTGPLHSGARGVTSWRRGKEDAGSVGYSVGTFEGEPTLLWLEYTTNLGTGPKTFHRYWVKIESTPCHFGRRRYWFICPMNADGRLCQRRSRILYLPPGGVKFGCRECHRLTYDCRQQHRNYFYETMGKHQDAQERLKTFKPPRSPDQRARRNGRIRAAERGERDGWDAVSSNYSSGLANCTSAQLGRSFEWFERWERKREG